MKKPELQVKFFISAEPFAIFQIHPIIQMYSTLSTPLSKYSSYSRCGKIPGASGSYLGIGRHFVYRVLESSKWVFTPEQVASALAELKWSFILQVSQEKRRWDLTRVALVLPKEALSTAHLRGDKGLCNQRRDGKRVFCGLWYTSSFDIFYQLLFYFFFLLLSSQWFKIYWINDESLRVDIRTYLLDLLYDFVGVSFFFLKLW